MFENIVLFGKTFSLYQITAVAGILIAGFYACIMSKRRKLDDNDMILFLLVTAIGVLIGGHLVYGLTQLPNARLLLQVNSLRDFLRFSYLFFGGSVFYGGLLGGMAAGSLYIRKKKWEFSAYVDIMASTVPLFHVFGRLGCFLSGCCYGIEFVPGITYRHALVELANGVPRFPVQLVEAGFNLLLFLLLHRMFQKGNCRGRLFELYLLMYTPARFVLEFLRGDDYRGFFFRLSTSQWISLLLFIVTGTILIRKRRKLQLNAVKEERPRSNPV